MIYISFIRPILEYGDVVWSNCNQQEKQELEKIQIEAARIVTGTAKLVSIHALYDETGWETFESRRYKHKLVLFYKMQSMISPLYLSSLVPPTVDSFSRYNLRNANDIRTVEARTNLYYQSFLPSVVRDWNSLDDEDRTSASVSSFKNRLNRNRTIIPKYYYVGDRKL